MGIALSYLIQVDREGKDAEEAGQCKLTHCCGES